MDMFEKNQDMQPARLDTQKRFVRVTGNRGNQFVEFDFAIGEPELFVEMILTREAFAEFCVANQVQLMAAQADSAAESEEAADWNWRLADATQVRFKH